MECDARVAEDFFEERGLDLPIHLKTKTRRWASLVLVVLIGAFACGPVASWPVLEPILIREGVFAGPQQLENLSFVSSIAIGLGLASCLFSGMLYDAVGPRALASCGAFLVAICLVGMAISIKFQALNNLLWFFYPLTLACGYANNYGAFAWLRLLPESPNTVAAFVGAIQILSDSLVLLAVFLHDQFGLSVSVYLMISAFFSVVTGFVCLALIPSFKVYWQVVEVQKERADIENSTYGAIPDNNIDFERDEAESACERMKKPVIALMDTLVVLIGLRPSAFLLQLIVSICSFMFATYPVVVMYPLYLSMLGGTRAKVLVDISGVVFPVATAVSLILAGRFIDYAGVAAFLALMIPWAILGTCFVFIPSMPAQMLAQVFIASLQLPAISVMVPRWCLSYLPPELFGSGYGIYSGILGLAEALCTPVGAQIGDFLASYISAVFSLTRPSNAFTFLTTIAMWCVFLVVSASVYMSYLLLYPMPEPGATTMADVRNVLEDDLDVKVEAIALKKHRLNLDGKATSAA